MAELLQKGRENRAFLLFCLGEILCDDKIVTHTVRTAYQVEESIGGRETGRFNIKEKCVFCECFI